MFGWVSIKIASVTGNHENLKLLAHLKAFLDAETVVGNPLNELEFLFILSHYHF